MLVAAKASHETFGTAFAEGSESVGGAITIMAGAATGNYTVRINDGADEGNAADGRLFITFVWMESEFEFVSEIVFNNNEIA